MDKTKKKNIRKIIAIVLAVLLTVFLAVMPLLTADDDDSDGPTASILSTNAAYGTVETSIIGGGTLTEEDAVSVSIPSGVMITEYFKENGDAVAEGDAIASVDRVTVMTAIASVQEALDTLAEEIETAGEEDADDEITAQAGGTVKALYAEEGDSVQDVMLEYGSLGVLNLDDLMAVKIETGTALNAGSTVILTLPDETEVDGRVESYMNGVAVITLEDEEYAEGDTVQAALEDGTSIGSGTLYLHSPWNITAYTGTVSAVKVDVEDSVSAGKTLFTLEDTGSTAEYELLIEEHREYEELMLELFQLYQSLTVTAPCDGIISGVDDEASFMLAGSTADWSFSLLSNAPNGVDTVTYSNYICQVTGIENGTLNLLVNPEVLEITDYKELSELPLDPEKMTIETTFSEQAPVYELIDGEWEQIPFESVMTGDTLLIAGDETGSFVWIVRITDLVNGDQPGEPGTPAEPSATPEPAATPEPTVPTVTPEPAAPSVTPEPAAPTAAPATTEPTVTPAPSAPAASAEPETPTGPTTSAEPTDPETPSEPTASAEPEQPTGSTETPSGGTSYPQTGSSTISGFTSGYTQGSVTAEPEAELYSLEKTEIAAVTAQNTMSVTVTVDELDIASLSVGQTANITVNALSGENFTGTVTEIGNAGTNEGGSSKFTVQLTMDRAVNMLAGMNACVYITENASENALTIPTAALNDDGSKTFVYTSYDEDSGTLGDPVEVTVGLSDGETAEILSGLSDGDEIFYAYYDTLESEVTMPGMGGGFSLRFMR